MDLKGIELTWLGHSAIRIRTGDGTTILIDPWLEGNPACPVAEHTQQRVDAIFLTHGHFDHLGNTLDVARTTGCHVFAIHEIAIWLEAQGISNAVGCNKGGMVDGPGGVRASLTDAVHSSGISGEDGIVPGGEAGGWVIDVPDGPTIYHAGDTTIFNDMSLIADIFSPDIAVLPIGGHYTMGAGIAARAGKLLGVEAVVPVHFGTFPILTGTPDQLRDAAAGSFEVPALEAGVPVN